MCRPEEVALSPRDCWKYRGRKTATASSGTCRTGPSRPGRPRRRGPRGRRIYKITDSGTADLREWLVHRSPDTAIRSEWALQAFLLPLLDTDEALGVLERMRESSRAGLAALEAMEIGYRARWAAKERPLGEYAFDLGLRQARMLVQWVEDTEADVRRRAAARHDRSDDDRPGT